MRVIAHLKGLLIYYRMQIKEILGLTALGLHSAVAVTLGYRDAANDYLSGAKKVRRAPEKLIIRK